MIPTLGCRWKMGMGREQLPTSLPHCPPVPPPRPTLQESCPGRGFHSPSRKQIWDSGSLFISLPMKNSEPKSSGGTKPPYFRNPTSYGENSTHSNGMGKRGRDVRGAVGLNSLWPVALPLAGLWLPLSATKPCSLRKQTPRRAFSLTPGHT